MNDIYNCVFVDTLLNQSRACPVDNMLYPSCQPGKEVCLNVDTSDNYSEEDAHDTSGSSQYFYASTQANFSDIKDLKIKHDIWPKNFTILTSALGSELAFGAEFLYLLSTSLNSADNPKETLQAFEHFAYEQPLITENWYMDTQHSVGQIGEPVGWLYNRNTLQKDAERRHLIIIRSNDAIESSLETHSLGSSVERIVSKYLLQRDHIYWVFSPRFENDLLKSLQDIANQIPTDQKNEVMIIYQAHGFYGANEWTTKVHDGILWNTMLDEERFKQLIIETFPPEKVVSVLLIVESCFSGMLVK